MNIPLEDKRRSVVELFGKLQHLFAAVPLFLVGISKLGDESEQVIAAVEVVLAAMLFITFAYEWRIHAKHSKAALGWFDLAAGSLLMFEAIHGVHVKPLYERAPFFAGLVALAVGLFHHQIHSFTHQRRFLKLSETGVEFRLSRLRHWSLNWRDLASVDVGERAAVFKGRNGKRHTIDLKRFRNAAALRTGLLEYAPRQVGGDYTD